MKLYFSFFLFLFVATALQSQTLNIQISGVRSSSGNIQVQFFTSKENFDKEKPLFTKTAAKTGLQNGILKISYTGIPAGEYGIAILDDENSNQKMDYGIILPKEGFGFSDYYHTGMGQPDYNKFKFTLGKEAKTVSIKVRYL